MVSSKGQDPELRQVLWFIGVPVVALVAGAASSAPIFVMGLVIPMFIVGPLALLTGSLLAALSAGWVANFSVHGASARTRSRLWAIFAVALAASLVGLLTGMAGAFFINEYAAGTSLGVGAALVYLPGAVIFSDATAVAAWKFRTLTVGRLGVLGKTTLALATAWAVFLVAIEILWTVQPAFLFQNLMDLILGMGFWVFSVGSLILAALGIFLATRFSRGARERSLRWDAALSLMSVGLTPTAVAGAILLGCSVSYCGA